MKYDENPKSSFFGDLQYKLILPEDEMLNILKKTFPWDDIRRELETDNEGIRIEYPEVGQPSLDPVIIFKLLFLQKMFNLSDREVVQRSNSDLLFRRFLKIPIPHKIPDFTNLTKYRTTWGKEKIDRVFKEILGFLKNYGLADPRNGVVIDITHINASIQKPTARKLIMNIFNKYLTAIDDLGKAFSLDINYRDLCSIISQYSTFSTNYETLVATQVMSKTERFDLLLRYVLTCREALENCLPTKIPDHILNSKQCHKFVTIKELLSDILEENVNIDKNSVPPEQKKPEKKSPALEKKISDLNSEDIGRITGKIKDPPDISEPNYLEGSCHQKKGDRKIISEIDPEARSGQKSKTNRFTGYKNEIGMTTDGFIVSNNVISGSDPDVTRTTDILFQIIENTGLLPSIVSSDTGFDGMDHRLQMHSFGIQPGMKIKNKINSRNKDKFSCENFEYNISEMTVKCPAGKTTNNHSYSFTERIFTFHFDKDDCNNCELRSQCTSAIQGRTVRFHEYHDIYLHDLDFQTTEEYQNVKKYTWQLEGVFGTNKKKHGLAKTPYKGIIKTHIHTTLISIVHNAKKFYKFIKSYSSNDLERPLASGRSVC